jgi:hypothetical protein
VFLFLRGKLNAPQAIRGEENRDVMKVEYYESMNVQAELRVQGRRNFPQQALIRKVGHGFITASNTENSRKIRDVEDKLEVLGV